MCVCTKSLQSCLTLCNSMDCGPQGSSFHGILQATHCSGLTCPSPGDLSNPGIEPASLTSPTLANRDYYNPGYTYAAVICSVTTSGLTL